MMTKSLTRRRLCLIRLEFGDMELCRAFSLLPTNVSKNKGIIVTTTNTGVHVVFVQFDTKQDEWVIADLSNPLNRKNHKSHLVFDSEYSIVPPKGIILSLAGFGLKPDYLYRWQNHSVGNYFYNYFKKTVSFVEKLNLPIVLAIHDVQDLFPPLSIVPYYPRIHPVDLDKPWIDVWDVKSPELKAVKDMLDIPDTIPVVPYSYGKPETVENILTTLLAEIDKNLSSACFQLGVVPMAAPN